MDTGLVKGEGFAVDASVMEANASRYHGKAPEEIDWSTPERQTRTVVEFLSSFDDENADAERKPPKVTSPTDPCSAWTAKANKRVQFGYGLNYLIDTEHAVIVDVEATPARTFDEIAATRTMIDRDVRSSVNSDISRIAASLLRDDQSLTYFFTSLFSVKPPNTLPSLSAVTPSGMAVLGSGAEKAVGATCRAESAHSWNGSKMCSRPT